VSEKGYKQTKEHIEKRISGGPYKRTKEHCENMAELKKSDRKAMRQIVELGRRNKGKKFTKEHCENISKAKKGISFSEEYKQNMSRIMKSDKEHMKQVTEMGRANKGKRFTKEHIKKMMRKRVPTSLEEKFMKIVDEHDLPYVYVGDGSFVLGNCCPDFININNEKIAVEVFCRFYKEIDNRDINKWKEERREFFKKYGWELIFFNEIELTEENVLQELKK